jgi:CheY-like chemotaxis protein
MSSHPHSRLVIVDDDPADAYVVRRAVAKVAPALDVAFLPDAQAFVDFYTDDNENGRTARSQIVLLDINMPVMTGFDALRLIAERGARRHTPIIMFSTSSEPDEVARAYSLGVNGYVRKPHSIEDAEALVVALDAYWLSMNISDV